MTSAHGEISRKRCLVEAAAWRSHLTEHGVETSAEFETWLAEPDNAVAWRQIQSSWSFVGEYATSPELLALRHAALEHAHREGAGRWTRAKRGAGIWRAAAAASVATVLVAVWSVWAFNKPDVYRTVAGERRVVTLSDGSQVALDAQSEVRVAYSDSARALTLVQGQARFDVVKSPMRPFTVEAAGTKVVATGTAFNVDLLGSELRVTLIEGRVLVVPLDEGVAADTSPRNEDPPAGAHSTVVARSRTIELAPGEQVVASSKLAPVKVAAVDVDRTTSWQQGRLVFENEPLSSVALRVSRYNQRPLHITDPDVAAMRISGVFKTGDMDGFVATITSYLPVRADTRENGAIELARRE